MSKTAVARDTTRAKALGADLQRVRGTTLDRGAELDALAKMPRDKREQVIRRAETGAAVSARKRSEESRGLIALRSAWAAAGAADRKRVARTSARPRDCEFESSACNLESKTFVD